MLEDNSDDAAKVNALSPIKIKYLGRYIVNPIIKCNQIFIRLLSYTFAFIFYTIKFKRENLIQDTVTRQILHRGELRDGLHPGKIRMLERVHLVANGCYQCFTLRSVMSKTGKW